MGAPEFTAAVIANIETGRKDSTGKRRRDVTIDEVLRLAYALGVPPVLLFTPLNADERLAITATAVEAPFEALLWITGQAKPANVSRTDWNRARSELSLYQGIFDAFQEAARVQDHGDTAFGPQLRNLATLINLALDSGLEPPSLPDEWTARMRAEGWLRPEEEG